MIKQVDPKKHWKAYGAADRLWKMRDDELLVSGPAGTGKAQPLTATVWTPDGPRLMSEIGVGDQVLTPDGGSAEVIDIPFRGERPVCRITFSDGRTAECCEEHLWQVGFWDSCYRVHEAVLPFHEIVATLRFRNETRPRYWIPMTEPVAFVEKPVPIPAYTLGVLLGDGYLRPGEINFTSGDKEVAEMVAAEVAPLYCLKHSSKAKTTALAYRIVPDGWRTKRKCRAKVGYVSRTSSGKWMGRVRIPDQAAQRYVGSYDTREEAQAAIDALEGNAFSETERTGEGIHAAIDALGLRNARSATKFVPDLYKLNSVAVRRGVLRGLMDTDGFAERSATSFTSISRRLAEDVRWLAESLGGVARITTKQPPNGQLAYTVWIKISNPADLFGLGRKRDRCVARTKYPVRRWIESIEEIGPEVCQCITIAHPDGLYLTDSFVVTHNSRACL
jgi:replicative DNA helicase